MACFVIGVFIAVLGAVMFSLTLNFYTFGILYTLGNVVAISSTLFLMGPVNQVSRKRMYLLRIFFPIDRGKLRGYE